MRPAFALDPTQVEAGWFRGVVTVAADRFPVLASWLEDTPTQLVLAARACLRGDEARVVWVEEPDSRLWTLTPDASRIRLLVQGCAGIGPSDTASFEPIGEETYLLPRRGFAVGVLAAMDMLGVAMSVARYESEWLHPWPAADLTGLRRALGNRCAEHRRHRRPEHPRSRR